MIEIFPVKRTVLLLSSVVLLLLGSLSCSKDSEQTNPGASITPETALTNYLSIEDDAYSWEQTDTYDIGPVKVYVLLLTSQKWREHTWVHQLNIFVPSEVDHDGAIFFIDGGSVRNGTPRWTSPDDQFNILASLIAIKNKAVTAVLGQTPNQPLYNGLSEDALISFTLHNFRSDGDYTWPLLFPMVKSAQKGMDAVQEFGSEVIATDIERFLVTGASKRGWTTWLSAAVDHRVEAIAPMVIDILNMPISLGYQLEVWDDYSPQIADYVELGIVQEAGTSTGNELAAMIDPYAYRSKLTMPKMIVIGTNDEFWPVDAVKHYLNDIPGENHLHYAPNAGHGLGSGAEGVVATLSGFFGYVLRGEERPKLGWELTERESEISLDVTASSQTLRAATLWTADSADRDFRDAKFDSSDLDVSRTDRFETIITYPADGFRAFFIELTYEDPNGGTYTKSTRMFVANDEQVL